MNNSEIAGIIKNKKETAGMSLFELLLLLYILHIALPAFGYYTPSIAYAGLVAILYVLMIAKSSENKIGNMIVKVLPVFSISLLTVLTYILNSKSGLPIYLYGEAQNLLLPLTVLFIINNYDRSIAKRTLYIIGASYIVTAVTTYIGCKAYPGASRLLATNTIPDWLYSLYCKNNIGGFDIIYTLVLIVPLIMYLYKTKKVSPLICIAALIAIGMAIVESEYTTALLFFIINIGVFLFTKKVNSKKIIIVMLAIILLLAIFGSVISGLLEDAASAVESTTVATRLRYFAAMLSGQDATKIDNSGDRIALYMKSINNFLSSPLLGTGRGGSGHSLVLDNMSRYGLIGLSAVVVMYVYMFRLFIKPHKNEAFYGNLLWIYMVSIVFAIINTQNNLIVIAFIIPLFGYSFGGGNTGGDERTGLPNTDFRQLNIKRNIG